MKKKNCWEYKRCGRVEGGSHVEDLGTCPASTVTLTHGINGGTNSGRICWAVAGTFCGGEIRGTFAQKQITCMSCEFFKNVQAEEGSRFVMMTDGIDATIIV